MKAHVPLLFAGLWMATNGLAHDLSDPDNPHPHFHRSVSVPQSLVAQVTPTESRAPADNRPARTSRPAQAAAFEKFAPQVSTRYDERFLYVESNGLPAHNMMVGITAWQQQVPLPQHYSGANAWQIPLSPVPAKEAISIKNRFLRGAIAIAANGIPIFNPQNNRGEISQEIGELDEWGGHCGRADDYHYHAAPLHLQSVLGKALPIAYALDGYAIYGLTEPDGSAPVGLDSFNGHTTVALGYHYHASTKYPYVNGGFHGEVIERGEQVDPQPHAQPVRPALQALRGAKITGFVTSPDGKQRSLTYTMGGRPGAVNYADAGDNSWKFQFVSTDGSNQEETYQAHEGRGGSQGKARPEGERPPRDGDRGGSATRREGEGPDRRGGPREEGRADDAASAIGMDALKMPSATFVLSSPVVAADGKLPVDFTGDGSGATLPLAWQGAPAGTQSYALVMDHLAPGNVVKSYWTLWDIPANTTSLPKNVQGVGKVGTSFKGQLGYEPPHSQGPGAKTYVLTIYALSARPPLAPAPRDVTREILLAAIKGKVLASASLNVEYSRESAPASSDQRPPRREGGPDRPPQRQSQAAPSPAPIAQASNRSPAGGPDNKGLVKPTMADTVKVNVYADNWFVLYINGELVAVDPIKFTPHNVVSVDLLPEYPMTIAVMAKDNADPKTGLEYGDHIGDGGFIIKFADGTVSNATWKAKNFFKGPLNRDVQNPRVERTPIPDKWWAVDFDDSQWPNATEYTEQRVNPKQPYYDMDFAGARFIWSEDLDLDNTLIFRTKIEKPGWTKRWNTKADIDVTNAPFQ